MDQRYVFGQFPVLALVFAFLGACDRESYSTPGELPPATHPETMQRIAELGASEHRGESFSYELRGNCELDIRRLLNGAPAARFMVSLKDVQLERYDYSPGLGYAVRSTGSTANSSIVIFQAPQLASVQKMLSLLVNLKAECSGKPAT